MSKNFDNLTKSIPYFASSGKTILLDDGTLFTALKLKGIDTVALPDGELISLKSRFKNVFDSLPQGFVVQIFHDYDFVDPEDVSKIKKVFKSKHAVSRAFQESYLDKLLNAELYESNVYLFLIWPSKNQDSDFFGGLQKLVSLLGRSLNFLNKESKNKNERLAFKEKIQELSGYTERVQYALKNLMLVESLQMAPLQIENLIFKFLNPTLFPVKRHVQQHEESHECPANLVMTMREKVTHSVIEEHTDHLKIGENSYLSTLVLRVPSQSTDEGHSEDILNTLNFPFAWSFSFKILDTQTVNSKLEARQRRKHAFVVSSDNPNIGSTISKNEIEQAIADQKINGFNWHETAISFLICAPDMGTLKDRVSRLTAIFRDRQSALLTVDKSSQMHSFKASLPGLGHLNDRRFLFTSLNVSDLAPISEPSSGTKDLSCYFQTHRDTLFRFSTFSDEFNNWNQVVIGKIGSGKSFIVNNILNLALMNMETPRVMILDLGQSFKRTTQLWGGEYITIDLDHPDAGLNPLPPRHLMKNKNETVLGLLDFTVNLLLLMTNHKSENRFHARIFKKAVLKTYERLKDRDPILSDLYDTLIEAHEFVQDEQDAAIAKELAKLLEDFIDDGPYARLFNRQSTLSHESDFFCFDFKTANDNGHIREIATFIVGGYICRKMVENAFPKFIVFDEFSTTLKHETGAALCELIAKNCRKHGASFVVISQQVSDFLQHKSSETIYKQANFKWFLSMTDNVAAVQQMLKINDTDVDSIRKLNTVKGEFSEVYLVYGDQKARLKLCPDPLAYWAATTDARDKRILEAYLEFVKNCPNLNIKKLVPSLAQDVVDSIENESNSTFKTLKLLSRLYPRGAGGNDLENDSVYQNYINHDLVKAHQTKSFQSQNRGVYA